MLTSSANAVRCPPERGRRGAGAGRDGGFRGRIDGSGGGDGVRVRACRLGTRFHRDARRAACGRVAGAAPGHGEPGPLEWAEFTGAEGLAAAGHGLQEPFGPVLPAGEVASASVIFVPALAVDERAPDWAEEPGSTTAPSATPIPARHSSRWYATASWCPHCPPTRTTSGCTTRSPRAAGWSGCATSDFATFAHSRK